MAEKPKRTRKKGEVTVTCSLLNMRDTPGGGIIDTLKSGTTLDLLEDLGEWLHIRCGKTQGYVMAQFTRGIK